MERFGYIRAADISEAVALLNEPGIKSRALAGSTDLALLLKRSPHLCDRVIDISLIPELHSISRQADTITIGAAATFSEVIESQIVTETAAVLSQACGQVGAVQVRNMGTIGGNVVNAAACADSLPALICLDAVARVITSIGQQEWPVSQLVTAPNRTIIPPGGLLVSLSYHAPEPGSRSVFLKLGRRNAMAISRLTVAVLGRLDTSGRISEARLVTGSATPHISRYTTVEEFLMGKVPSEELFQAAAQLTNEDVIRLAGWRWSSEYKMPALTTMITRAFSRVFEFDPVQEEI